MLAHIKKGKEELEEIKNIDVREIAKQSHDTHINSTILIVDKKHILTLELQDDKEETFEESIGLCTYSTSKPTILSYISIFESLWAQTEMNKNLRIANEKLIQNNENQKTFINTAAHELRTPTQNIVGYCEINGELFKDLMDSENPTNNSKIL